jgi:hypothetical protein
MIIGSVPCLLDGGLEDVARAVDKNIDTAVPCVGLGDGPCNRVQIRRDIEHVDVRTGILQRGQFAQVASCREDSVTFLQGVKGNFLTEAT